MMPPSSPTSVFVEIGSLSSDCVWMLCGGGGYCGAVGYKLFSSISAAVAATAIVSAAPVRSLLDRES